MPKLRKPLSPSLFPPHHPKKYLQGVENQTSQKEKYKTTKNTKPQTENRISGRENDLWRWLGVTNYLEELQTTRRKALFLI